jgi:hypothetical protein
MGNPVKTSESIACALGCATSANAGVVHRDGVFYAHLPVCGQEAPLIVALHGVLTELQAIQALELLLSRAAAPAATGV